jgi:RNA polymerase sigma-70 factor, ECF subfamily
LFILFSHKRLNKPTGAGILDCAPSDERIESKERLGMPSPLSASAALSALGSASAIELDHPRQRLEQEVVELFDEFRLPLLRYLSSFGLPLADSEEVLQEVFLSLFQHLQRGKSRENLQGWLFRVAHNLGLKRRYRAGRDLERGTATPAIDPAPSPEDQMVSNQIRQRALQVVKALPEQDRRCLILRAEGLRYREIAGILDMSLGAVSLSLSRSLARIARSTER